MESSKGVTCRKSTGKDQSDCVGHRERCKVRKVPAQAPTGGSNGEAAMSYRSQWWGCPTACVARQDLCKLRG